MLAVLLGMGKGSGIHCKLLLLGRKVKPVHFSIINTGFAGGGVLWWAEGRAGNWGFLFHSRDEGTAAA